MNNTDKYIHFFQKVEDGLPEKAQGDINSESCMVILSDKSTDIAAYNYSYNEWISATSDNGSFFDEDGKNLVVTHFLNMDRLTTKEKALELIEASCRDSYECESARHVENVIESYKNDL